MVFQAAETADWLDPVKTSVDHVGFGLVRGLDRKSSKRDEGIQKAHRPLNRGI